MKKKPRRASGKGHGFFDSDNPEHILNKLAADYQRVARVPSDRHAFMDFVNTANILHTWMSPQQQHGLGAICDADKVLLDVCRELANNVKHYYKEEALVADIVVGGLFDPQLFDSGTFDTGELMLKFQGEARTHLGEELRSDAFGTRVVEFWRAYFKKTPSP